MQLDHETWQREMRRDTWKFLLQVVLGIVASAAAGAAVMNYIHVHTTPPAVTAPAQAPAPG